MNSPSDSEHTAVPSDRSSSDWTIRDAEQPLFDSDLENAKLGPIEASDQDLTARFRSGLQSLGRWTRQTRNRYLIVLFCLAGLSFLTFHSDTRTRLREHIYKEPASHTNETSLHQASLINVESGNGIWPSTLRPGEPSKLCDICDCNVQPGYYNPSPSATRFQRRPSIKDIRPEGGEFNRDEYLRQIILDIYCARQHMKTHQTTRLVRRTASHFDQMASWNISGLDFGKQTVYMTTSTSPTDKTDDLRPQYFRRHARHIMDWMSSRSEEAGTHNWQVLWVIVEDEVDIDPAVIRALQRIGVPYVYFAYGPTNSLANAQKNANMQLVYELTTKHRLGGILGHGPVYGLDDDNKILPELIDYLIDVEEIGVLPVGNFDSSDGYEKPILSQIGEVMGSESPWFTRKYPFDYAGFTFNSSLLGTRISGPMFWKHTEYAGESEFIDQVVTDIRELEPLCGPQLTQDCHVVWHNEPLTELEELSDDEEDAFMESYGLDVWEARLQAELEEREFERGY